MHTLRVQQDDEARSVSGEADFSVALTHGLFLTMAHLSNTGLCFFSPALLFSLTLVRSQLLASSPGHMVMMSHDFVMGLQLDGFHGDWVQGCL